VFAGLPGCRVAGLFSCQERRRKTRPTQLQKRKRRMAEKNDVFVGNITFNTTEEQLKDLFSFIGE
jgi:RNA recognition motif-containing protein